MASRARSGNCCPSACRIRVKPLRRQFEFRKLEAGSDGASDERVSAERSRALPGIRRHDDLRPLGLFNIVPQNKTFLADPEFQRRATMKVPYLRRIDAMPARDLARLEQKQDGSGVGPAAARLVAKTFTEMAAFRMRLKAKPHNQIICFTGHAYSAAASSAGNRTGCMTVTGGRITLCKGN